MTAVLLAYAVPRSPHDGIHDYSASVAAALNRRVPHLASVALRERSGSWRDEAGLSLRPLSAIAKDGRTSLLALQYNPFSYSRGLAPSLLAELARLRRSSVRLALVVHEPYVNTGSLRMRLLGLAQRGQLRALTGLADHVLITTERWRPLLPIRCSAQASLAVAGSNLPDQRRQRLETRVRLGLTQAAVACVTVGLKGPHQLADHVRAALDAVHDVTGDVVHLNLGRNATPLPVPGVRSILAGPRPAVELAALVGAGDIFLAPYADGATTRRTGLAAALQHGLAIVATAPEDSSAPWDHGGMELTTDVTSFAAAAARFAADPALRQRRGHEARAVFERLLDWQVAVEPYFRLLR